MKKENNLNFLFFILALMFFISLVSANDFQAAPNGIRYDEKILDNFGENNNSFVEVIIEFKDLTSQKKIGVSYSDKEIRSISEWDYSNRINAEITEEGLEKLLGDDRIKSIYYDFSVQASLNDSSQIIGANYVWNNLGYTGDGIKVCVIDSGIDGSHPDLLGGGCFRILLL